MAPKKNIDGSAKKAMHRGTWTAEEDRKLAQYIEIHGARRWKTVAIKSGLNRCGKSCRLRWLNYLRPNIKRGNISDEEEDLILRLHKLLGNRWSLIAGRLPGRTDNEIKNYWNSHLCKKTSQVEKTLQSLSIISESTVSEKTIDITEEYQEGVKECTNPDVNFNIDEFFDFSIEGCHDFEWVNKFMELDDDDDAWLTDKSDHFV